MVHKMEKNYQDKYWYLFLLQFSKDRLMFSEAKLWLNSTQLQHCDPCIKIYLAVDETRQ